MKICSHMSWLSGTLGCRVEALQLRPKSWTWVSSTLWRMLCCWKYCTVSQNQSVCCLGTVVWWEYWRCRGLLSVYVMCVVQGWSSDGSTGGVEVYWRWSVQDAWRVLYSWCQEVSVVLRWSVFQHSVWTCVSLDLFVTDFPDTVATVTGVCSWRLSITVRASGIYWYRSYITVTLQKLNAIEKMSFQSTSENR